VLALQDLSGCRFSAIGVGPDRDQTVVVHDLIGPVTD
jgi:adenylosuccinate synthase